MIELRPARDDEMGAIGTLGGYAYGGSFGDGPDSVTGTVNRPEWTLCAFDGDRLASSFVTLPFTMRANGVAMSLGGVSAVATHPEYRRRGLVRQIMTRATEEMRDRGQSVASLWASQAAIYQRFGYARASVMRNYTIDVADIGFHDGDGGRGDVRWFDAEGAFDEVKALYIAFVADRTGYLHRSRPLWSSGVFAERAEDGPVYVALSYGPDGEANGYLIYTLRGNRIEHRARSQELIIRELVWLDPDAYRSLWSYVARHDLVGRVVWTNAPADDPAEELFVEPRMLHRQDHEGVWFRIVDAAVALAERGYSTGGQATIEVVGDQLAPWNDGVYAVETDGTTTAVERSGRPDATMAPKSLAALFTGFTSARRLRAWGLIDCDDDGAERLDRLFATRHLPHTPDHF